MATPVTNFGLVTVSTGYEAGDTSIVLTTGHGSRLPSTYPYPLTWWNATDYAHPADDPNKEIVSVTARSTDTLTVTRAQEGTSATAKNTGGKTYRMSLGITKTMWDQGVLRGQTHVGLLLKTHSSSDLAVKQVELVGVDYIVMDDGTLLTNDNDEWTGKVADITVSGAGGLDTGVEGGGVMYDIYAIAKEDGTRNLLLHKSKVAILDTFFVNSTETQGIRSAVDNSTVKVSQGFQVSNSGTIPYIALDLRKVGTPTGTLTVTLESSSAGLPTGTVLATSYAIDVTRLPTSAPAGMMRIPMQTTSSFSSATQYHIVLQGTWTVSATNYVVAGMDGSAATYANGSKALFDSDTAIWTADSDDDLSFQIYIEVFDTPVTLPTGYTKQCHLGYVANDGSSDFVPFMQIGRSTKYVNAMSRSIQNETSAGPLLYDLGNISFIPSRDSGVVVHVALTGTGAASATYALGDWRSCDISSTTGVGAQIILHAPLTTEMPCAYGSLHIEYGGIYGQGTAGADLYLTGFEW